MKQQLELISLNVDDLDIEELEQRLELAFGIPSVSGSYTNDECGCWIDCLTRCPTDCCAYDQCFIYDPNPCPPFQTCATYDIP